MLQSTVRRSLLAHAAAALATLRAVPAEARKRKNTKPAFRLVTGCATSKTPPCACNACERHAANKIFASRTAVVRAHIKCNCRIEEIALPKGVWTALFRPRNLPAVTAVDKRDPRVGAILDRARN